MTNRSFLLLKTEEKNTKLKAVLNKKSGGVLTGKELDQILVSLQENRQYEVMVYRKPEEFCDGVNRLPDARTRLVLGADALGYQTKAGELICETRPATIAVTVGKQTEDGEWNQLHILIPQGRCGGGAGNGGAHLSPPRRNATKKGETNE